MSDVRSSKSSGLSFAGLLTIVFITLKLCHVIDWSWWWVLAPAWGPVAVLLAIALTLATGAFFVAVISSAFGSRLK